MRVRITLLLSGMLGLAIPLKSSAAIIDAYNFGPNGTSFTYAATTLATNVTASGINSTSDFGANDSFSQNNGVGGTSGWYTNNSGGNYLSVSSTGTTSDNGYWVETIVTAASGYALDPSSFELFGGAGGSSNVRSAYIFDNVDGFPTSITPIASSTPTIVGGDLLASGPFTAVRGSSGPPSMNEIQVASFPSSDVNLTSFTVRVYFDTQGNASKNIDLGTLELDGSVVAVPEPATFALVALAAVASLRRGRRMIAGQ
jgi:hypothetical protein